ncbi:MAG: hypothetical protein E7278_09670 [Lachnospiraceae bacterium]|nr:hypothetical protein [Lachnospiraceae bacterium]
MTYTFRAQTSEERKLHAGGSKICEIYDFFTFHNELEEKTALAYGQLKTLFGEPTYSSKNFEELYQYDICAESDNGGKVYLCAYCGPTGPSIGGDASKLAEEAANALAQKIQDTPASDYEIICYYLDGPSKIIQGVKDGKAYMQEEEADYNDPELAALINY